MKPRRGFAIALLVLAACGGASSPSSPPPAPGASASAASAPSKVFLADAAKLAIGSLIDPNPAPGTVSFDRVVAGPATGLGTPGGTPSVASLPSTAHDPAADRLYVATQSGVLVFDGIGTANGNVARSRAVQSVANGHAVVFRGLHIAAGDVLYAVEPSGEVQAFNRASTLNGSVPPDRTITPDVGATINSAVGVAVDMRQDMLYVGVVTLSSSIIVFNNASAANTAPGATLKPDRTLNFSLGVGSFFVDETRDILYASLEDGVILVFDKASTLATGIPVPNRLITLTLLVPTTTSGSKQLFITVDTDQDRLYAVNGTTVFIVNGASVADDPMMVAATQVTVSSASSLLSAVAVAP